MQTSSWKPSMSYFSIRRSNGEISLKFKTKCSLSLSDLPFCNIHNIEENTYDSCELVQIANLTIDIEYSRAIAQFLIETKQKYDIR